MPFGPAKTPALVIQKALYDLASDTPGLPPMYDDVPEKSTVPGLYIEIGEVSEVPDNAHGSFGRQTVHTFHVWGEVSGYAPIVGVVDTLTAIFDHKRPEVEGPFDVVSVKFEFLQLLKDQEAPNWRHGIVRFRTTTEQREE